MSEQQDGHQGRRAWLRRPRLCAEVQPGGPQTQSQAIAPLGRIDPTADRQRLRPCGTISLLSKRRWQKSGSCLLLGEHWPKVLTPLIKGQAWEETAGAYGQHHGKALRQSTAGGLTWVPMTRTPETHSSHVGEATGDTYLVPVAPLSTPCPGRGAPVQHPWLHPATPPLSSVTQSRHSTARLSFLRLYPCLASLHCLNGETTFKDWGE